MSQKNSFPHGIDITAPGGIEKLLDFHRANWGDMQMNADAGAPPAGDPPAGDPAPTAPADTPPADPPAPATTPPAGDPKPPWGEGEFDPDKAWNLIQNLRDDVKTTKANQEKAIADAVAKAAQDATSGLTQTLGKALGLVKDETTKTPEQLLEELTAERDTTTSQLTDVKGQLSQTQIELAVYRSAAKASGNPDALLDSRSFIDKVKALDPTADDFNSQVEAAITAAVEANPALKQAQAAQRMGGDPSGGNGAGSNQLTREELQALSPQERLDAHKAGRTKNITG